MCLKSKPTPQTLSYSGEATDHPYSVNIVTCQAPLQGDHRAAAGLQPPGHRGAAGH